MRKIFEDFFSVRSAITLGAFGVSYFLMWNDRPVPDLLRSIINLLLGFWFGTKVSAISAKKT